MHGGGQAQDLHALGTAIFKDFELLVHKTVEGGPFADQLSRTRLVNEEQRFRLWAHSLGLHRTGHASLDYRLRDAVVVRNYATDVIEDLKNNLDDLLAIVLGVRKPYELDDAVNHHEPQDLEDLQESSGEGSTLQLVESGEISAGESSNASSESSFHEVDFRLTSIAERIDALFRLAVKIRSPANRPTRTTTDLFKRIPAPFREEYIREREQAEISIVTYVQRQQLSEALRSDASIAGVWNIEGDDGVSSRYVNTISGETRREKPVELMSPQEQALAAQDWKESISTSRKPGQKFYTNKKTKAQTWHMPKEYEAALNVMSIDWETAIDTYGNPEHWIIRRTGIANARRRQQFVYWKEHANMIGKDIPEKPAAIPDNPIVEPKPATVQLDPTPNVSEGDLENAGATTKSLATSATKLQPDAVKLDDLRSVISHQSRVSTVVSPQGEKIEWPPPPVELTKEKFFTCPYCSTLCPQSYLSKDPWRVHVIHDLQPYHCTYPDCADPHRLYGSRHEWLSHENQHRRVWRCALDQLEFETQPLYIEHLEKLHAGDDHFKSPELVAAAVDASSQAHRDCPFCPTAFTKVVEMQKHITWHLEKLALFALPDINDQGTEAEDRSERSSDSKQGIRPRKGRQKSIMTDFSMDRPIGLSEDYGRGERQPDEHVPTKLMFQQVRDEHVTDNLDIDVLAWLESTEKDGMRPPPTNNVLRVQARFDFEPSEPGQLQFMAGDMIDVVESNYENWWKGSIRGRTGVFPLDRVHKIYEKDTDRLQREMPSWYLLAEARDFKDLENAERDKLSQRSSRESLKEPPAPSIQTTFPADSPFSRSNPRNRSSPLRRRTSSAKSVIGDRRSEEAAEYSPADFATNTRGLSKTDAVLSPSTDYRTGPLPIQNSENNTENTKTKSRRGAGSGAVKKVQDFFRRRGQARVDSNADD